MQCRPEWWLWELMLAKGIAAPSAVTNRGVSFSFLRATATFEGVTDRQSGFILTL